MCGIVGWVSSQKINKGLLQRMSDTLAHRGPEGEGYFFNRDMTVGLAHKRLSIVDPESGQQPMGSYDRKTWIIFNGIIFNFLEIKRELIIKGYDFQTDSDTEVILYAYIEWKEKCLDKLNGMFAFVIYDERENRLFGARDRIGEKPFYYYYDRRNFIFASEIKALIVSNVIQPELNDKALYDYLTFQFYLGDKTLFRNIIQLEPGYYFILDLSSHKLTIFKYWDISFDDVIEDKDEQFFVNKLESLLIDSVMLRLRTDVPWGSYLSGGIDSSTITVLSSLYRIDNNPIHTFSGKFLEGDDFDETKYAKEVAAQINSVYHEIIIRDRDFLNSIYDIIWFLDEPEAGPGVFSQYRVATYAKNYVKVVLGGQGGDEIFMGYPRYFLAYYERIFKRVIQGEEYCKYILEKITKNLNQLCGYELLIKDFFCNGLFERESKRYFRLMNRLNSHGNMFSSDFIAGKYPLFEEFDKIFSKHNTSLVNKMTYFDMKTFLPSLLHVEDRINMANGLEPRAPLLDYRIIDFVAKIPSRIKFKNGSMKYLLKKVVKNIVPDSIIKRKDKKGFPTPINLWFKSTLNNWVRDILSDKKTLERGLYNKKELLKIVEGTTMFGRALWGIINLELWFRTFVDK